MVPSKPEDFTAAHPGFEGEKKRGRYLESCGTIEFFDEHGDFFGLYTAPSGWRLNQVYRAMKFDVIRLLSRMPTLEERRHLRDMAMRMVEEAAAPGDAATPTQVNLPERPILSRSASPGAPLPRLRCSLVYELARPGDGREEAPQATPDAGDPAPG